eukprot:7631155-Heterocapsa_arctica.AAC.1
MAPTTGCPACENLPFGAHNARCRKRKAEYELKVQKNKEGKLLEPGEMEEEFEAEEELFGDQMDDEEERK